MRKSFKHKHVNLFVRHPVKLQHHLRLIQPEEPVKPPIKFEFFIYVQCPSNIRNPTNNKNQTLTPPTPVTFRMKMTNRYPC